jgi:hypothetical protein
VSEREPDRAFFFSAASAVLFAGVLLFGTACDREQIEETISPPPLEALAASDAPIPEPGTAWVEFADGRVSVLSNGAQRLAVLRQLAQRAGFELVTRDLERRALRLRIEDAALGEAFFALLRGVRYGVEYAFDADLGSHVVVRLSVGEPVEAAAEEEARPAAPDGERKSERTQRQERPEWFEKLHERLSAASPEERRRLSEKHAARAEELEALLLDQLGDADPELRADAVFGLPIGGEGEQGVERLRRVAQVLADDPDPRVRMAAAQRLGESDSRDSVASLVAALSDPDREVVLEAIEALEDIDDASVIPDLEALLRDPDPGIREAAGFAIEYLRW